MELYHAAYYMREDGDCRCTLCPNRCRLKDGAYGRCHVRVNRGGVLYSESYGRVASVNIDPIEKKPLVGFMPGTRTFSVGTLGCNLDCDWCQNDSLSRFGYDHYPEMPVVKGDVSGRLRRRSVGEAACGADRKSRLRSRTLRQ